MFDPPQFATERLYLKTRALAWVSDLAYAAGLAVDVLDGVAQDLYRRARTIEDIAELRYRSHLEEIHDRPMTVPESITDAWPE